MAEKKIDFDFEIPFYEGVLKRSPQFFETLSVLGDLYTRAGRFEDGLRIDKQIVSMRPNDPYALYNLACSYSLLRKLDLALEAMQLAVECGYHDFQFMRSDPDLAHLLADPGFQKFLSKVENRPEESVSHEHS
ncbi:MAG TPA: hypothetical protein P5246_00255 [Candidatus Omnitrophota bacterium]|jgi:tetratricopeptide (TPR) repeat protein|nr:hypothetical protein [Candidatus Omnitrophota bacterium]HSA31069.1 hypothetical protein [Candidatus Omnitrophota bacterium]